MHTPADIARDLGVSVEWIRRLCRRVLKQRRKHHRLTDAQRVEVEAEYQKFSRKKQI